ncbi:MAG TPA: hypothetical protein VJW93_03515 [Candidatus Acidoferrales bacterium]|nr:hypothetical protein [Candidatus Acidoferrales bacterium]
MSSDAPIDTAAERVHSCTSAEIEEILRERGWLSPQDGTQPSRALQEWLSRAGELLGPHAATREDLCGFLEPLFSYDAAELLRRRETQEVLARTGAREVLRELGNRILEGGDVDSDRFKQIVEDLKLALPYRSRAMFHPIRLALTGRAGEGELDRVILLIDSASKLDFRIHVKSTRQRMLEFCAALD